MTALPGSLALTSIADGSNIVAADHRNNYAAVQTDVNQLITALSGGSAGQVLQAISSSAVGWVSGAVRARVTKSAVQALSNDTLTVLTWDTEIYDTDNIHDNVTNNSRLTASTAGVYVVQATIVYAASGGGVLRGVAIRENNLTMIGGQLCPPVSGGVFATTVTASALISLNAGQYVECLAYQDSGGALNVAVSEGVVGILSAFAMARVGI